jgi:hypothetical protein
METLPEQAVLVWPLMAQVQRLVSAVAAELRVAAELFVAALPAAAEVATLLQFSRL